MDNFGLTRELGNVNQFEIILDANIIFQDLIWLCKGRSNPLAKTQLLELFHSQTVIAQAPTFLKDEIELHLSEIAEKKQIELSKMQNYWKEYQRYITFHEITVEDWEIENVQDPKDYSYIKLQLQTGALIYSKDSDIPAMDGKVVKHKVIASLRDYARHSAIEYTYKIAGVVTLKISSVVLSQISSFLQTMFKEIKDLPKWMHWISVFVFILLMLHKKSREKIFVGVTMFFADKLSKLLEIVEEIVPMIEAYEEAKENASKEFELINQNFVQND